MWEKEEGIYHNPIVIDSITKLSNIRSALEVGAGSGKDVEELSKKGINVTYLDSSEVAAQKFKDNNPPIPAIVGGAFNLPFKDNSFDIVYSIGLYHLFSKNERKRLLGEMKRVSKRYILIDVPQKYSPFIIVKEALILLKLWKFGEEITFSYKKLKKEVSLEIISKYGRESFPVPRKWRIPIYKACRSPVKNIWIKINRFFYFGIFINVGVIFKK